MQGGDMTMTGMRVVEVLLALGDGDSVVVSGTSWTSFESDGFEVEDLRAGDAVWAAREEVMSILDPTKPYEVLR